MVAEKMAKATAANAAAKRKPRAGRKKALVAMYQSQLSDNVVGIKIRLKKAIGTAIKTVEANAATRTPRKKRATAPAVTSIQAAAPSTSKSPRKRQRKSKQKGTSDSEDSGFERKRSRNQTTVVDKQRRTNRQPAPTATNNAKFVEPVKQTCWGNAPDFVLLKIFERAVGQYGSLPLMVNLSRVCQSWRRVSSHTKLWHTLDLSTWTKDKTEIVLKQIASTKILQYCKEINLGMSAFSFPFIL